MPKAKIILKMAMTPSGLVGNSKNPPPCLPWGPKDLPGELKLFKEATVGFPIIMGSNTAATFNGRPLPERINIVLSRSGKWSTPGFETFSTLETALAAYQDKFEKIFIIGGAKLAKYALNHDLIDEMQLTITTRDFEGDVNFPDWDINQWKEVKREAYADSTGREIYDVVTYERIR